MDFFWFVAVWSVLGIIGYATWWLMDLDITLSSVFPIVLFGAGGGPVWVVIACCAWVARGRPELLERPLIRSFRR